MVLVGPRKTSKNPGDYSIVASDDEMDVKEVHARLGEALRLQLGSLVTMTVLAGSLGGMTSAGLKAHLREYVQAEIHDTYRLAEKLTALGGTLPTAIPDLVLPDDSGEALGAFVD